MRRWSILLLSSVMAVAMYAWHCRHHTAHIEGALAAA